MTKIFVSYARKDLQRVEPIVDELVKQGLSVFIDRRDLLPGSIWPGEIAKAVEESHCVLVVWTYTSVDLDNHHWVREEAGAGLVRRILLPVRLDPVALPFGFQSVETADLSNWNNNGSHPNFQQCIKAIRAMVPLSVHGLSCGNYVDDTLFRWYQLDKKRLKQQFKLLCRLDEKLKVIFVEHNIDALSNYIHHILYSVYLHLHPHQTVGKIKGNMNDDILDLEKAEYIEEDWAEFVQRIFEVSGTLHEVIDKFNNENLGNQVHFIVLKIDNFNRDHFAQYYAFWQALHLERPLFLFCHVEKIDFPDNERQQNYLFPEDESVDCHDFTSFFDQWKDFYKEDLNLCRDCPPITFREAVEKLHFKKH